MENLTYQDRDRISRDIFNISRRIRQIANRSNLDDQIKLQDYIKQLNEIGTEVAGGVDIVMGKVLRS